MASTKNYDVIQHKYDGRYPDDPTYCEFNQCPYSEDHPVHQTPNDVSPIIAFASYLANECDEELRVSQAITPGKQPEAFWVISSMDADLVHVHVLPNGEMESFEFKWLSEARSVEGFDVVPFLLSIIHWLQEGN